VTTLGAAWRNPHGVREAWVISVAKLAVLAEQLGEQE
jgi:hypothetical protein